MLSWGSPKCLEPKLPSSTVDYQVQEVHRNVQMMLLTDWGGCFQKMSMSEDWVHYHMASLGKLLYTHRMVPPSYKLVEKKH